jgi:hypothetical protein
MSLHDFLRWDDGIDTRYELIDSVPVAMAPPAEADRVLSVRLSSRIDSALQNRRPCNAQTEAGVPRSDRSDSYYIADIGRHLSAERAGYRWQNSMTGSPFRLPRVNRLSAAALARNRRGYLGADQIGGGRSCRRRTGSRSRVGGVVMPRYL